MRVARLHAAGDLQVADEPPPETSPGCSRVRMLSVGLCGSDLHWFTEGGIGDAVLNGPLVPGHEMSGRALDGPLAGTLVGVDPAIPCGRCPVCLRGDGHLCAAVAFAGHAGLDGGMREELVWPTSLLHPLPDGYDSAQAALLEPLGVAVHALDLSHLRTAATVGVVGCGPIGLMLVHLAAALGARVVASEPLTHRREAAVRAGAEVTLAPEERDGWAERDGCPVVFEAAGADDAVAAAAALVAPGGRIVLLGIPERDSLTLHASVLRRKGITLAFVRRMTEDAYVRGIRLATSGVVELSWLTTHRFDLDRAADAFAVAVRRSGLKVVVDLG